LARFETPSRTLEKEVHDNNYNDGGQHEGSQSRSFSCSGRAGRTIARRCGPTGHAAARTQLITIPGTAVPYPYGGKQRQVQVDLNPEALRSKGLSALDVVNTIAVQNLILPCRSPKL
jgi:hypothetical protein